MKRNKGGFTLVELLVTIAVSSIVLAAAASLLLFGFRVHKVAQEEAGEQQTVRIVLSALENLATSGKIYRVEPISGSERVSGEAASEEPPSDGWQLRGKNDAGAPGSVLLRYSNGKLVSGADGENVLLDGLRGAQVELDGGGLLTFTFRTEAHSYSTSVFCRTGVQGDSADSAEMLDKVDNSDEQLISDKLPTGDKALSDKEKQERYVFLQTLASQYGSTGQIVGITTYYAEWYGSILENSTAWNEDTPWCACFLSWAAAQQNGSFNGDPPRFANVDTGMAGFQNGSFGAWGNPTGAGAYTPIPGDYIFFDWSKGTDPDHVGAVLCVEGDTVYTIEGNSGGKVAVHSYSLNDPRIVGYGVLNWNK